MALIRKYFPHLTPAQTIQLQGLHEVYRCWNERINLISRKDIEHLNERHILHSLAIAKLVQFPANASILDVGTGGGFPGIPLAILFPQCRFTLVDSVGKKIMVVREVVQAVGLPNVVAVQARAESLSPSQRFDYVVSRAVTDLATMVSWVWHLISKGSVAQPHGMFYLKGGELSEELSGLQHPTTVTSIADFFDEEFFETKKIVSILKL
jgi:16S rRNA (guanine527-N7)-methyltransferase